MAELGFRESMAEVGIDPDKNNQVSELVGLFEKWALQGMEDYEVIMKHSDKGERAKYLMVIDVLDRSKNILKQYAGIRG